MLHLNIEYLESITKKIQYMMNNPLMCQRTIFHQDSEGRNQITTGECEILETRRDKTLVVTVGDMSFDTEGNGMNGEDVYFIVIREDVLIDEVLSIFLHEYLHYLFDVYEYTQEYIFRNCKCDIFVILFTQVYLCYHADYIREHMGREQLCASLYCSTMILEGLKENMLETNYDIKSLDCEHCKSIFDVDIYEQCDYCPKKNLNIII